MNNQQQQQLSLSGGGGGSSVVDSSSTNKQLRTPTTPTTPTTPSSSSSFNNNNSNNNNNNNMTTVTIPRDKYEELIKEFQKLQQQNSLLKRAVIDEQKKNKALNLELDRKTTQLEQKTEETDRLGYNNLRLEKRLTQLMFDLEEYERNNNKSIKSTSITPTSASNTPTSTNTPTTSNSNNNTSFFGSFLLGSGSNNNNNNSNNNNQQQLTINDYLSQITQLKKDMEVISEDLQHKIKENERVHIELFELKSTHELSLHQLRDQISDFSTNLQQKEKKLEEWSNRWDDAQKRQRIERETTLDTINQLKQQLSLHQNAQNERNLSIEKMNREMNQLRTILAQKMMSFDDTRLNCLNILNVASPARSNSRVESARIEMMERSALLSRQLTKGFAGLYASMNLKIQLLSKSLSTCHSPTIKHIAQRVISPTGNVQNTTMNMDVNAWLNKYSEELGKATETLIMDAKQSSSSCLFLLKNDEKKNFSSTLMMEWQDFVQCKKQQKKHWKMWMKSLKNWLVFHRDTLLYLVVCVQDGDCYSMEPPTTPANTTNMTMMTNNNSSGGSSSGNYMKFQEVYMRMTPMTRVYKQLYDSMDQCVECIDESIIMNNNNNNNNTNQKNSSHSNSRRNDNDDENHHVGVEKQRKRSASAVSSGGSLVKKQEDMTSEIQQGENGENEQNEAEKTEKIASSSSKFMQCMQKMQDDLTMFMEVACTTIAQEQKVVFVSPMIKSANEKITKSLSVIVSVYSNILKSFQMLTELNESNQKVYSRGVLCDYSQSSLKTKVRGEFSLDGNDDDDDDDDSMQFYYKDNDSVLSSMQFRGQKYLSMLGQRQAQDVANFENISLSEAIKNKQLVEKLKKELDEIRSKLSSYEEQIDEYESVMDSMREEVRLFERRFYECFVNWNLSVQRKNMTELIFEESKWNDNKSKMNLQAYVDQVDDVLQRSLEVFDTKLKTLVEAKQLLESRINHSHKIRSKKASESTVDLEQNSENDNGEQLEIQSDEHNNNDESRLNHHVKPLYLSKSDKCIVKARPMTPQDEKLFSPADIHREIKLKEKLSQQTDHLMKQIEICDLKAVEYRLQWQQAVIELEEATERENQLSLRLNATDQLLQLAQDDLRTHTINYENQIQILSDNLAVLHHRLDLEEEMKNQPNSILSNLSFFTRNNND